MKTLADRIEALIPNGDGYNSDYANTLAEAAEIIRNKYPLPDDLYPDSKDWLAADYNGRVEWLHSMYESKKSEIEGWQEGSEQAALKGIEMRQEIDSLKAQLVDWRAHSAQFAKGEKCPNTLETAQAAWARDQELIFEQKAQIVRLKDKINKLSQEPARVTLEKALELLRDMQVCLAQGEAIYPNSLYEQDIYRLVSKHD